MPFRNEEKRKAYYERHKKYYDKKFKSTNRDQWNKYQREYKKARKRIARIKRIIDELDIAEEGTLTYKAAVIFFCLLWGFTKEDVQKRARYSVEEINLIIGNWVQSGIYSNDYFLLESSSADSSAFKMEVSLIAMAGSGEIIMSGNIIRRITNELI